MTQDTTGGSALVHASDALDEQALRSLGLVEADRGAIAEVGRALRDITPGNLHVFGRDAAGKTAAFSSQLLEQVRNRDLDEAGDKLARSLRSRARSTRPFAESNCGDRRLIARCARRRRAVRVQRQQTADRTAALPCRAAGTRTARGGSTM